MAVKGRVEELHTAGLADEIAFRLRADILDGRLPQGARLPHEELAARFGVSRTPIREALRQLQAMNLLVVLPNRGATVRSVSREELTEAYELRAELEGFACELACKRASAAELAGIEGVQATLTAVIGAAKQLSESELDAGISGGNDAFHKRIHAAARNTQLTRHIAQLEGLFPRNSVWRAIAHDSKALIAMNVSEHVAIAKAIRNRNHARARAAMREHVLEAGSTLLARLAQQGFWR